MNEYLVCLHLPTGVEILEVCSTLSAARNAVMSAQCEDIQASVKNYDRINVYSIMLNGVTL